MRVPIYTRKHNGDPTDRRSELDYRSSARIQAKSSNILCCATVFAVAQVSENIGHVLEGLWAIAMRAASDPNERAVLTITGVNVPTVDVRVRSLRRYDWLLGKLGGRIEVRKVGRNIGGQTPQLYRALSTVNPH
ncbi:hypothetical protein H2200_010864 [Cladophialophora chaetospira]|uniref:Uncharacterized protein n=1 Tax=Cladophialophora chaetospira TaxID=386627 RepID=A0AA38X102_9EURO|nr:hypothetical protein H2200_010864 [Cladophialophora chaetospira]